MKKRLVKDVIRQHQPCGGGYGVAVQCTCGADFSADHQVERLNAADASGAFLSVERGVSIARPWS